MKKILLSLALAAAAMAANAQWIRIWNGGESTRFAIADASEIFYSDAGSALSFLGNVFPTAAIDSITVVNPVVITWDGATANVTVPETAEGVTYSVDGGHVVIDNACTSIEHEFVLMGNSADGSLTYNGNYKVKFHLAGVNLTSATGAALDIQCGKRIDLILEDGTQNSLTDAAGGLQRAALNCQGHLEVGGSGSLEILGKARHALRTKEYLLLKKSLGALTVSGAASDGIHVGEFFQMNGGTLTIGGTAADGLQVETDATSTEEQNGQLIVAGGTLDVTLSAADSKAIRLDADATDASIVPQLRLLDGQVKVSLTATALGSKAVASDGDFVIGSDATSPVVDITVAAGVFEDPDTGEENRATGLKADQTLTIAGGTTTVRATGAKSRGVRAATLTATGGSLTVSNTGSKSQGIKLDNTFITGQGGTVIGNFKY